MPGEALGRVASKGFLGDGLLTNFWKVQVGGGISRWRFRPRGAAGGSDQTGQPLPKLEALLLVVYRRVVDPVAFRVSSRRGESSGFAISRNNHVSCGGDLTSLFAHKVVGEIVDSLICPRVFNRNALYWIVFAIEFAAIFRVCRLTLSIDMPRTDECAWNEYHSDSLMRLLPGGHPQSTGARDARRWVDPRPQNAGAPRRDRCPQPPPWFPG